MKEGIFGVPSGDVITETPDGILKTASGGRVLDNGPYCQENYPAWGMPGMGHEGYHLRDPQNDPMPPFSQEPLAPISNIKNGK